MNNDKCSTTKEKAHLHEITTPLLDAMYREFKELSKKKPDSPVSINKIKIVNRLLEKMRIVLFDEESLEFLDLLNEDEIPQTSDVTIMLSQYVTAMERFEKTHRRSDGGYSYVWFID